MASTVPDMLPEWQNISGTRPELLPELTPPLKRLYQLSDTGQKVNIHLGNFGPEGGEILPFLNRKKAVGVTVKMLENL